MAPGDVLQSDGSELCLEGPGEFVLVPFYARAPDGYAPISLALTGRGFEPLVETGPAPGGGELVPDMHALLRARERAELMPRLRLLQRPGGDTAASDAEGSSTGVPAAGSLVTLDASLYCEVELERTARVAAVTEQAVVVVDTSNPGTDWTDDDYGRFGRLYDSLVHPVVSGAFGEPSDLDRNQRVVLFFTSAVNQLSGTLPGQLLTGLFWRKDLLPRGTGAGECASSNEGEILYLLAPDPAGEAGPVVSEEKVAQVAPLTLGHELQHLINAARRLHEVGAPEFEEIWLDEGLSVVAEELLFYAASDYHPESNLTVSDLTASDDVRDAFDKYAAFNIDRFGRYLVDPQLSSPTGPDALATRGATWAFLRYAIDRAQVEPVALFDALMGGSGSGIPNLAAALNADPLAWMQDWTVAVVSDDWVPTSAQFQQPSWNFREVVPATRLDTRFPLRVQGIADAQPRSLALLPGGSAYFFVRLDSAAVGSVRLHLGDGRDAGPHGARLSILRLP